MTPMKVKHQVFVSSTYEDLREERQEVMHALLELDCIPSGMELFPAANDDQWTLIQRVIDECDYYILILGGRYGTIGPGGMGYTEMEYRYALNQNKPILSFLHDDPGKLLSDKTEQTDDGKKKFQAFRELARKKLCKTWTTPEGLGSVVSRGLVQLRQTHPAVGWVRGNLVPSRDTSEEILSLRKENEQLQEQLRLARFAPPQKTLYFVVYDNGGLKASNVNQTLEQVIQNIHDVPPPSGQWQKAEIKGVDGLLGGIFSTAIASAALFPNEHLRKTEIQKLTRLLMDIPTVKVVINKGGKK